MIKFRKENNLLILCYSPTDSSEWVHELLNKKESFELKKTFIFTNEDLYEVNKEKEEFDFFDDVEFVLGYLINQYYLINGEKLGINHDVYVSTELNLKKEHFITHNKISIFRKIANLVNQDICIGGKQANNLPFEEFERLVKSFPNTYEIKKYVNARLSVILRNYFENTPDSVKDYERYMNLKTSLKGNSLKSIFRDSELNKYILIREKLKNMLSNEIKYNEKQWQREILEILLLIFPKYILVFEEVKVRDTYNNKDRKLDYLLIDSAGNVDIVEIKKPFDNSIVTKTQYRDNYIPMRELSGTVMQIEKYIFYLNKWGRDGENWLTEKYKNEMPENFQIHITNPSAIIIMGREVGLSKEQLQDFEIIKRKYKNVVDIITYDDLLNRLNYIIEQLKSTSNENQ